MENRLVVAGRAGAGGGRCAGLGLACANYYMHYRTDGKVLLHSTRNYIVNALG